MLAIIVLGMVLYFFTHFLYFWVKVRSGWPFTEGGIFCFHAQSIAITTPVVFLFVLPLGAKVSLAATLLFFSLHTIYSLSFLELWALVDGSYSLTILEALDAGRESRESIVRQMVDLGSTKMAGRLGGLAEAGLVLERDGIYRLSGIGRLAARLLSIVERLTNQNTAL